MKFWVHDAGQIAGCAVKTRLQAGRSCKADFKVQDSCPLTWV